ncbi:hypothetical protein [Sponge holobiont-associated RNA virus]|nr:hypothetical protein [Sponge holobiont-associated RNA virus]
MSTTKKTSSTGKPPTGVKDTADKGATSWKDKQVEELMKSHNEQAAKGERQEFSSTKVDPIKPEPGAKPLPDKAEENKKTESEVETLKKGDLFTPKRDDKQTYKTDTSQDQDKTTEDPAHRTKAMNDAAEIASVLSKTRQFSELMEQTMAEMTMLRQVASMQEELRQGIPSKTDQDYKTTNSWLKKAAPAFQTVERTSGAGVTMRWTGEEQTAIHEMVYDDFETTQRWQSDWRQGGMPSIYETFESTPDLDLIGRLNEDDYIKMCKNRVGITLATLKKEYWPQPWTQPLDIIVWGMGIMEKLLETYSNIIPSKEVVVDVYRWHTTFHGKFDSTIKGERYSNGTFELDFWTLEKNIADFTPAIHDISYETAKGIIYDIAPNLGKKIRLTTKPVRYWQNSMHKMYGYLANYASRFDNFMYARGSAAIYENKSDGEDFINLANTFQPPTFLKEIQYYVDTARLSKPRYFCDFNKRHIWVMKHIANHREIASARIKSIHKYIADNYMHTGDERWMQVLLTANSAIAQSTRQSNRIQALEMLLGTVKKDGSGIKQLLGLAATGGAMYTGDVVNYEHMDNPLAAQVWAYGVMCIGGLNQVCPNENVLEKVLKAFIRPMCWMAQKQDMRGNLNPKNSPLFDNIYFKAMVDQKYMDQLHCAGAPPLYPRSHTAPVTTMEQLATIPLPSLFHTHAGWIPRMDYICQNCVPGNSAEERIFRIVAYLFLGHTAFKVPHRKTATTTHTLLKVRNFYDPFPETNSAIAAFSDHVDEVSSKWTTRMSELAGFLHANNLERMTEMSGTATLKGIVMRDYAQRMGVSIVKKQRMWLDHLKALYLHPGFCPTCPGLYAHNERKGFDEVIMKWEGKGPAAEYNEQSQHYQGWLHDAEGVEKVFDLKRIYELCYWDQQAHSHDASVLKLYVEPTAWFSSISNYAEECYESFMRVHRVYDFIGPSPDDKIKWTCPFKLMDRSRYPNFHRIVAKLATQGGSIFDDEHQMNCWAEWYAVHWQNWTIPTGELEVVDMYGNIVYTEIREPMYMIAGKTMRWIWEHKSSFNICDKIVHYGRLRKNLPEPLAHMGVAEDVRLNMWDQKTRRVVQEPGENSVGIRLKLFHAVTEMIEPELRFSNDGYLELRIPACKNSLLNIWAWWKTHYLRGNRFHIQGEGRDEDVFIVDKKRFRAEHDTKAYLYIVQGDMYFWEWHYVKTSEWWESCMKSRVPLVIHEQHLYELEAMRNLKTIPPQEDFYPELGDLHTRKWSSPIKCRYMFLSDTHTYKSLVKDWMYTDPKYFFRAPVMPVFHGVPWFLVWELTMDTTRDGGTANAAYDVKGPDVWKPRQDWYYDIDQADEAWEERLTTEEHVFLHYLPHTSLDARTFRQLPLGGWMKVWAQPDLILKIKAMVHEKTPSNYFPSLT